MKSKVANFSKNALIYGIGIAFNQLMNVLLLPLLTHHLTTAEYGVIGILNTILFVAFSLFLLGFNVSCPIVFFSDNQQKERDNTISTAIRVLGISGIILLTIGVMFIPFLSRYLFADTKYAWC